MKNAILTEKLLRPRSLSCVALTAISYGVGLVVTPVVHIYKNVLNRTTITFKFAISRSRALTDVTCV